MKQGRTITQLTQELERQNRVKRDYVADTRAMEVRVPWVNDGSDDQQRQPSVLSIDGVEDESPFTINHIAHGHMAARTKVPKRHYDRLLADYPDLWEKEINTILATEHSRRMVRTLDGRARAFLSDRYRRLDNYDLLLRTIPVLQEAEQIEFASCEVTDRRLYLKVVFPRVQADVQVGDPVQAMVCLSNSEVGEGSFRVEPGVLRLVCQNGMLSHTSLKKYHVGRQVGVGDVDEVFTDETLEADDHAFWLKVQDVVRAAMDDTRFENLVEQLREATERPIENPVKAVEVLTNRYASLTQEDGEGILTALVQGDDAIGSARLTQYGLIQAVTTYANDVEDYERATDLEQLGGKLLELPERDWLSIAEAA